MGARIYLAFVAVLLIGSIGYVINPDMFAWNGQLLSAPGGRSDVRVMYGLLPMAIGCYVLRGAIRSRGRRSELLLCALIFGFAAAGRVLGFLVDGGEQPFARYALMLEAPAALIAIVLMRRERVSRG